MQIALCNAMNCHFPKSRALFIEQSQNDIPSVDRDYSFSEYYRKAYEYDSPGYRKKSFWNDWQNAEAMRDFYTGSLTEIKHLVQLDQTPDLDLQEPKWELYKISISFPFICMSTF